LYCLTASILQLGKFQSATLEITYPKVTQACGGFSAFTTDRIQIKITGALNGYSCITEVEAWGGK